ncbi:hypothetical protein [Dactylosporangium sp. NPDC051541]|uniref:hypothetical protein n=1 Tax=Dactylosporangium sp. NPDC051541 TaxID=3363977 RepID=UPI0037ACF5A5
MWQCGVCGSSNTGDAAACASCGAARPQSAALPAGPPVSWPASAPADAFGSWSPAAGAPPPADPAHFPADNWPGAGPGLGDQPPPWATQPPAPPQPAPQPTPPQVPPQAPPPVPWSTEPAYPAPPNRGRPVWIFPAIVALVLLLAGGTVAFVLRDKWLPGGGANPTTGPTTARPTGPTADPTGTATPTATATNTPTATPTTAGPPTLPASVGSVKLDPSLDPAKAPAVAAVFDKYFTAVNARNATAALAALDPNGSINQGDANAVKRFTDGISTSTDDDILLLALGPDPTGKGQLQARVTFRSQQQPGKGPKGRESETCTRWDVTYSITQPGGEYRIWGSTNAGNRPC